MNVSVDSTKEKNCNMLWKDLPSNDWYFENLTNNDSLLITVGDSWTWGDSLGKISTDGAEDDYEFRTTHMFGSVLAKKLKMDHVNMAIPGGWNINMHDHVKDFLPHVVDKYNKVYVVITLTELCREIIKDPIWTDVDIANKHTLDELLMSYEKNMFNSFKKNLIDQWESVTFLIGRNFTYSFDENISILGGTHLPNSWVDCMASNQKIDAYPSDSRFLTSSMALNPFILYCKKNKKYQEYKMELFDYYSTCISAIDWLDNSTFNHKTATRHPTVDGHKIWADYLYNLIIIL